MYNFSNTKVLQQPFNLYNIKLRKSTLPTEKKEWLFHCKSNIFLKKFRSLNNYVFLCRKKII